MLLYYYFFHKVTHKGQNEIRVCREPVFMWQMTVARTTVISSLKLHVISCKSTPSKLSLRKSQAMLCTSLNAYVGADGSGHDELGLQVSLYIGLPHWIVKVQVQGALAGHAAVAIAASRLAVGQPLIRSPLVPPGLPAQTLLLHQELQTFHLTPGCAVLCLTYTITWTQERRVERQSGIFLYIANVFLFFFLNCLLS